MPNGNHDGSAELFVPSSIARLNYFYGQLLAQRDLTAEQSYHVVLRRLLQRELFGTGTTAGLRVDAEGAAARGVFVRAGLALDPDGRELLLDRDVCIEVADAAIEETAPEEAIEGDTFAELAEALADAWGYPISEWQTEHLRDRLAAVGYGEASSGTASDELSGLRELLNAISAPSDLELSPGTRLVDHLFDALVGTTYVGLRYVERGSEPSPAVLDAACCGETTCFPARMQQGVAIVARPTHFEPPFDPTSAARVAISECFIAEENPEPIDADTPGAATAVGAPHDCRKCLTDYLLSSWRPLPAPLSPCSGAELPIVPLAAVYWSRHARTGGRILSVDNHSYRPVAPGGPVIHALFDAITQCAPPIAIPPIYVAIDPPDGARLEIPAGATSIEIRAEATGRLTGLDATHLDFGWAIEFTPERGGSVQEWSATGSSTPPFGVEARVENDGAGGTAILRLSAASGALTLEPGTYLWTIGTEPGEPRAETTLAIADAEPSPPYVVPSGDGRPPELAFSSLTARFYVTGS